VFVGAFGAPLRDGFRPAFGLRRPAFGLRSARLSGSVVPVRSRLRACVGWAGARECDLAALDAASAGLEARGGAGARLQTVRWVRERA